MPRQSVEEETFEQIVARLEVTHPDISRTDIESATRIEFDALTGRPVRDYIPILVERATKKRLSNGRSSSLV
ncbi:three-helix bundle dimerization domain-containing protein [Labedella endophytica]|jgi:hypothetical protein|uniref:DUF3562 domain-containing protein n=1 Tax=Labedella endophytica TaxID=1523160 RepID=A0A3S0XBD1_9MICO|nr:hypothetical protein [Labedella endophytica]RUR01403.1 hypothetical protein ELQ94_07835 [Labedella endophytica]